MLECQLLHSPNQGPDAPNKGDEPIAPEPMDTAEAHDEPPAPPAAQPSGGKPIPADKPPDTWVKDVRRKYKEVDTSLLRYNDHAINYILESYLYRDKFADTAHSVLEKKHVGEVRRIIAAESELCDIASEHVSNIAKLSSNLNLKQYIAKTQ